MNYAPTQEHYWAYWLEKEEDTLAWATEDNLLQKIARLPILDQKYLQLNQNRMERDWYGCTVYASVGAICDVMWYDEATYIKLVDATMEESIRTGKLDIKKGAYTAESVETATRIHNSLMAKPVSYFRTEMGKSTYYTLLAHNYTLVHTYKHSDEYAKDSNDGTLDGTKFGNKYGHCIRFASWLRNKKKIPTKPSEVIVLDNYYNINNNPESWFKRYKIPTTNIPFLHPTPFYNFAYFFIPSELL